MISVAVMAHRSRENLVVDLVQSIDADATVAWDQRNNEWDTGRRALAAGAKGNGWHVVLQDDALVCRDLTAGLSQALDRVPPNAAVSLYTGTARPYSGRVARFVRRAFDEGCSWISMPQLHWGVGIALPAGFIDEILFRADRTRVLEYDRRLSTVFRKMRMPIWYTVPSLVDHRDAPSLLRHDRHEQRRAQWFPGTDWSAASEWWGGPLLAMTTANGRQTEPRSVSR